jgi:uroporphyrinogen-III synthase
MTCLLKSYRIRKLHDFGYTTVHEKTKGIVKEVGVKVNFPPTHSAKESFV